MDNGAANEVHMGGKVYTLAMAMAGIDRTGHLPSGEAINGIGNGVGPSNGVDGLGNDVDGFGKGGCPGNVVDPGIGKGVYPGQGVDGVGKGGCTGKGVYLALVRVCMALARVAAQARVYTMALALVWMALAMVVTAMESVSMALAGASTPTGATPEMTSQTMHGPVDMLRAVHQWSVRSLHACAGLYQFLGMAGRCNAVQPAYAQHVKEEQQGRWVDHHNIPIFRVRWWTGTDGNHMARTKQEQLREALQTLCDTHDHHAAVWARHVSIMSC